MKKIILSLVFLFAFSNFCSAKLIEGIDYNVSYKRNPSGYANILQVNFITLMPNPQEALEILRSHLSAYGAQSGGKNIIGTAWHTMSGDDSDLKKMKLGGNFSAYVWLGRSKKVVPFPTYIAALRRR
ncbi:MAG: hypothetical protein LBC07_02705 [Elusimicrobiota bacterium]|jgi:hypothetical protein|nr:hypothetical protein [Elusimicrobiota bacterium]